MRGLSFANLAALAAVVGIAFGVAATLTATAAGDGFARAMREKILANTAHVAVSRDDARAIENPASLGARILEIDNVRGVTAETVDNVLLVNQNATAFAALRGTVEIQVETRLDAAVDSNQTVDAPPFAVEIGRELARKIGLSVGDEATILAASDNDLSQTPVSTKIVIARVVSVGLYDADATLLRARLADAARMTKRNRSVDALNVETRDAFRADETALEIEKRLGAEYRVLSWQTLNRPLFAALALERRVAILIVGLIIFVAALNLIAALALTINERRADIAILKTCGATTLQIAAIFVLQGALLGAIGIATGVVLGIAACASSNYFGWFALPPDVYELNQIELRPDFRQIGLIAVCAFALSLAASVSPAIAAARVRAHEILRQSK